MTPELPPPTTMKSTDLLYAVARSLSEQNSISPIWEGAEPPICVYRPELDLEIPIKGVTWYKGMLRVVIG